MSTFPRFPRQHKANELAEQFATFPEVAAVALGGSQSSGSADVGSDIDLYVNHRVAALLASYFDIVFALNRVLHPGEKQLLGFAHNECPMLPTAMDEDVNALLLATGAAKEDVVQDINRLLDRLDELLVSADAFPCS